MTVSKPLTLPSCLHLCPPAQRLFTQHCKAEDPSNPNPLTVGEVNELLDKLASMVEPEAQEAGAAAAAGARAYKVKKGDKQVDMLR